MALHVNGRQAPLFCLIKDYQPRVNRIIKTAGTNVYFIFYAMHLKRSFTKFACNNFVK